MKILVTGAAGFVGSHTIELLETRGHHVIALDNFSTGRMENLKNFHGEIIEGDITDYRHLDIVFKEFRPDAVLHLAAQAAITTSLAHPQRDLQVNGIGTLNVLKSSLKWGVKRFVFSSTSAVYRKLPTWLKIGIPEYWICSPDNPYGISKLAAEHYIRNMFPNHLIMRYGNIYGPRQVPIGKNQVVALAFQHFIKGNEFTVNGHGDQKRDFVYVGDVANANFEALTSSIVGTFNISSGDSYSVNHVLSQVEKCYEISNYPWEHTLENDPREFVKLNVSSILHNSGWKASTPLSTGLQKTMEWWEAQK